MWSLWILCCFLLSAIPNLVFAGAKPFREDGKWGFVDPEDGRVLVRPQYEGLAAFDNSTYRAMYKGLYGVIDGNNQVIVPFRYSQLDREGSHYRACVAKYEKSQYVSEKFGKLDIPGKAKRSDTSCGILDLDGNELIPFEYIVLYESDVKGIFVAGKGRLKSSSYEYRPVRPENFENLRVGIIDIHNNELLPMEYDWVERVEGTRDGKTVVHARKGLRELRVELTETERKSGHPEERGILTRGKGSVSFRFPGGNELVFEDAFDYRNGYARVKKDGKWGYIDGKGNLVVEPKYDYAWDSDGMKAVVRFEDGSTRHVDMNGRVLEEP